MSLEMSVSGPIDIPNKSSFKVNEVCAITGVKSYVLRFWESEFEEISPLVSSNGNKVYEHRDIEAILMIKKLLFEDKLSIDRAKAQMKVLMPRESLIENSVMPQALVDYAEGDIGFDSEFDNDLNDEAEEVENDYFPLPKVEVKSESVREAVIEEVQPVEVQAQREVRAFTPPVISQANFKAGFSESDVLKLDQAKHLLVKNLDLVKAIKSKHHWS